VIGPEKRVRPALLEMRTALLETRSAKSMRGNDRMQNFVFFNLSNESEDSDSEFFYLGEQNCLLQMYSSRQLAPKLNAEGKTTLLTMNECRG